MESSEKKEGGMKSMTPAEAGRILGISPKADMEQIKKQYRRLMHQFHPDVSGSSKTSYRYSVQEINLAYAVLKKSLSDPEVSLSSGEKKRPFSKNLHWDAPLNQHAWIEREILHYAEDYEGNVIGNFTIARGKYLWTTEEDFPLFLLSIYRCGQELLDEIDAELEREENSALRLRFQPQLTYLMAQQFMDSTALLKKLAKKISPGEEENGIYYLPAMLEVTGGFSKLKEEESLFPSRLKDHRLYLKNRARQELGYLSFSDDRFYYIVIPLFEQRRVLVKIKAAQSPASSRKRNLSRYHSLHLWLKFAPKTEKQLLENLNLQIRQLLETYRQ
mgnify:FL=1